MSKPRIMLTSRGVESRVRPDPQEFDIVRLDSVATAERDALLAREGPGIEAIICAGMERLDEARLSLLPDLRLIAVVAAGMAGIDLDAARARGIAVTNAGNINSGDVADFAVALYLAHRREIIANDRFVREDRWIEARRPDAPSISSDRVGVVGLGHIGLAIARRLAPFDCELSWWGPNPKPEAPWPRFETLGALAEWADVLIVAARGDDSSRNLVAAEVIEALGPNGLIVNVSRGFVIDEQALIAALRQGRLGGAALDVFAKEPMRGSVLEGVPNLLVAPHVAGATRASLDRVCQAALANVRALFAGTGLYNQVI